MAQSVGVVGRKGHQPWGSSWSVCKVKCRGNTVLSPHTLVWFSGLQEGEMFIIFSHKFKVFLPSRFRHDERYLRDRLLPERREGFAACPLDVPGITERWSLHNALRRLVTKKGLWKTALTPFFLASLLVLVDLTKCTASPAHSKVTLLFHKFMFQQELVRLNFALRESRIKWISKTGGGSMFPAVSCKISCAVKNITFSWKSKLSFFKLPSFKKSIRSCQEYGKVPSADLVFHQNLLCKWLHFPPDRLCTLAGFFGEFSLVHIPLHLELCLLVLYTARCRNRVFFQSTLHACCICAVINRGVYLGEVIP